MEIFLDIKYARELNEDDIIISLTTKHRDICADITIKDVLYYSTFTKSIIDSYGTIHLVNYKKFKMQQNENIRYSDNGNNKYSIKPYQSFFILRNRNQFYKLQFLVECHEFAKAKHGTRTVKTLQDSEVLKYLDQVTVKCKVCKEKSASCSVCFGLGRITTKEESIINIVGFNWCQCETPKPSAQLYETPVPVWKCTSCNKIQELENEQEM